MGLRLDAGGFAAPPRPERAAVPGRSAWETGALTPGALAAAVAPHARPADPARSLGALAAVWVSRIASPPVLAASLLVRLAGAPGDAPSWRWIAAFAAPAVLLPVLVVVALVRAGRVVDYDLSDRRQRHVPFAVAALAAGGTTAVLARVGAPAALVAFGLGWSALVAVQAAVTWRWKISLHAAAAGAAAAMAWATAGGAGAAVGAAGCGLVGVVGWSRVVLGRHTPRQVAAGAAAGAAAIAAVARYL